MSTYASIQVEVTTWYLEMLHPQQLQAKPQAILSDGLRIERAEIPSPEFSRFLYTSVGSNWYWLDRLNWSRDRWMQYLDRPQLQTWVAYRVGTPAGYFELEAQAAGNVEIVYFGIMPQFMGQQLGGHLLSVAVEKAWAMEARRVWVHTCSLDSPYALNNYQARGFQIYHTEIHTASLPEQPPSIWSEGLQPLF
jgi:ribosomal protein S18 acetylase RimI-like enzyme